MKLPDFFSRKKFIPIIAICLLICSYYLQVTPTQETPVIIDDPIVPLSNSPEAEVDPEISIDINGNEEIVIDNTDITPIDPEIIVDNGSLSNEVDIPDNENGNETDNSLITDNINSNISDNTESTSETVTSTKMAFYYLNIRNLDFNCIDMKKCYYVGKGTVVEESCDGNIQNVSVNESPEYNGEVGRYDYEWSFIDDSPGYYCVYGSVTPAADIQTEKMAFYYLNTRNLDLEDIDYKKCYYVGKGTVTEIEDYKGNKSQEISDIPEYNGSLGKYNITWAKISDESEKYYMVFGNVTPVENVKTEKMALYYLNTRNLDMENINYQKCYYVGKGSVTEDADYKGNISVTPAIIPDYNGEVGNYLISWDKISHVSEKDYYMVIGAVTKKETDFNSVEALKNATAIVEGDIVRTKGFYTAGDGGAAEYTITSTSNYSANDNRCIKLSNGLYATLNINNNTVCANQLGAYGDGLHDDVVVLQKIMDYGYNITLCSGKTYKFISSALYITNPITFDGKGATIIVDDSYAPQKGDSTYYLIRNVYGNKVSSFSLYNTDIKVNFSNNRISGREFVAVSPLLINNLHFENVNIETSKTNNCITCLWVDNGCDSVIINNCRFINNTSGASGGSLWLTSRKDSVFSEFKSLKNCQISNSYFFSSTADEVLGLWGTGNINAVVSNSTIEGNIIAQGRTRIISIVSQGDNGALLNVSMNNCHIKANCNTSSTTSYYDSVFGVGTDYPSNKVILNVINSDIVATVYGALIFPSGFRSEYITRFDANNRPVSINFTKCDINCSATVTGTATNYHNTGAEYPTSAWDCSFSDCSINCATAFAYLYVPGNQKYYLPKIEIDNCDIEVDNAKAFICQAEQSAGIDLNINDTEIVAQGVENIVESKSIRQRDLTTQKNAVDQTSLSDVSINGNDVTE